MPLKFFSMAIKRLNKFDKQTKAYFRKKKRREIGRFLKQCPFSEMFFLNLNQKCQKQLLIGGIRPIPALLGYPNALLLNKGALLLKRKALFQEQS